jgi:hypothetical protein
MKIEWVAAGTASTRRQSKVARQGVSTGDPVVSDDHCANAKRWSP